MARTAAVYGPYKYKRRWRIHVCIPGRPQFYRSYPTFEAAEEAKKAHELALPRTQTVEDVISQYEVYLRKKGNKPVSNDTTLYFLRTFLDTTDTIGKVTTAKIENAFNKYAETHSVDSAKNGLAQLKTFFRWCIQQKILKKNLADGIVAHGRRKKGKKQLTKSEARRFASKALQMAQNGDEGALAGYMALILGLRNREIRTRKVEHVDDNPDGMLLWVKKGKTRAAGRAVGVSEPLASILRERTKGKDQNEWLFPSDSRTGHRGSTWLRKNVKRVCKLADVPVVGPHGLRGTNATMWTLAGLNDNRLIQLLGHTSFEMTKEHYLAPGTVEQMMAQNMMQLVETENDRNEKKKGKADEGFSQTKLYEQKMVKLYEQMMKTNNQTLREKTISAESFSPLHLQQQKLSKNMELNGIEPSAS